MGLFDDAVPGGNISKPIMLALGALLVGKMMGGFGGSAQVAPAQQPSSGSSGGGFAGGGLGGALGGGLGGLLDRFTQSGHGPIANSWVGTGPNQPIEPTQLNNALGQTTVSDLARQAGMSEQELLAQLSRVLPGVVDKLTPNGQLPPPSSLGSIFGR
jgi:uncharacterized protein YidB (DUF937 family)